MMPPVLKNNLLGLLDF